MNNALTNLCQRTTDICVCGISLNDQNHNQKAKKELETMTCQKHAPNAKPDPQEYERKNHYDTQTMLKVPFLHD